MCSFLGAAVSKVMPTKYALRPVLAEVKKVDGNAPGDWRVRLARRGRPAGTLA
jgi:hypothetical protein